MSTNSSSQGPKLSERDMQLLSIALLCMDPIPTPDYEKFRELGGFKNTHTSSTMWSSLKKKVMAISSGEIQTPRSIPKKRKTNDEDGGSAKKPRGRKPKKKEAEEAEADADEELKKEKFDDDFLNVKSEDFGEREVDAGAAEYDEGTLEI